MGAASLAASAGAQQPSDRDRAACRAVAAHANAGTLEKLKVAFAVPGEKRDAWLQARGEFGALALAREDLDGDGRRENVVRAIQGTAHVANLAVYDARWRPLSADDTAAALRWTFSGHAPDIDLVRYRGRTYILGSDTHRLLYLSRFENRTERQVCEFRLARPSEKLVESSNDRLCRAALAGRLSYPEFALPHKVADTALPQNTYAGDGAARIDIDNDGVPDLVVRLRGGNPGGRGCEGFSLGVLNAERDRLDEKLTKLMPTGMCGWTTSTPFTFEGRTYIEGKYGGDRPLPHHEIHQVSNGKLELLCRFDVRLVHEVVD